MDLLEFDSFETACQWQSLNFRQSFYTTRWPNSNSLAQSSYLDSANGSSSRVLQSRTKSLGLKGSKSEARFGSSSQSKGLNFQRLSRRIQWYTIENHSEFELQTEEFKISEELLAVGHEFEKSDCRKLPSYDS